MVKSLATPVHLSNTPLVYHRHPPTLGEHTDAVATELGYSEEQIRQMHDKGVIA